MLHNYYIEHNYYGTLHTLQKNGQIISWKSIEHLYLKETSTSTPGVRLCHKLTKEHVWLTSFSRMRVYLAAQVCHHIVYPLYYACITHCIHTGYERKCCMCLRNAR